MGHCPGEGRTENASSRGGAVRWSDQTWEQAPTASRGADVGTIIIVDDSDTIRARLKTMLSQTGHEVLEAPDGHTGLELVRNRPEADLIITDHNMPGMDGTQMCARIRGEVGDFGGTMVMLTTESNQALKSAGKRAGIRYWLTKPVTSPKLLKIVSRLVG